jgi:serine protease Do
VKELLPGLLKDGHIIRPWIGFHGQLLDDELIAMLQMPLVGGLQVEVVEPGSPAEKAGIKGGSMELNVGNNSLLLGGDIVVSVNGETISHPDKFSDVMRSLAVGGKVHLKLFRDREFREVEYALPERPLLPGDLPDGSASTVQSRL